MATAIALTEVGEYEVGEPSVGGGFGNHGGGAVHIFGADFGEDVFGEGGFVNE